jgi:hypothetical protein
MTVRMPPALAMWLLRHLGSGYRSESLDGDLFEEYQHGRAPWWYWRQVLVAIFVARVRSLRAGKSRSAVPALLRLLAEIAILLGGVEVAAQSHQTWAGTTSNTLCVSQQCACHGGGPP